MQNAAEKSMTLSGLFYSRRPACCQCLHVSLLLFLASTQTFCVLKHR